MSILGGLFGLGAVILAVVALIVASGMTNAVWLLAFGVVALLVGLTVVVLGVLRLMDDDDRPAASH